ncbi:hypothetical protein FK949_gp183 [Paramecium bursaria Chlorella virus NYs1]|uniref:Uncharacterized protein n=1 Tax=Paramecium bursaria Chlorella virus NYs1 TaxID=83442 RepID=M1HHG2_9PHYC|nr:hypothetical protein FK949_gp183 [Paramecium bursaria Chlorella virus NYs1]AGE58748.1 hypothetical protein PBCVNYs1_474L [Paramecium bursaria Chlorella virus NYs1]
MNIDIYNEISKSLSPIDVANMCIAINDHRIINERKTKMYDDIFTKKMRSFWFGRLICLLRVFNNTSFWFQFHPNVFSVTNRIKHEFTRSFIGWKVDLCGNMLYFSTSVLDDIISISVKLSSPYYAIRIGDSVGFSFDIQHTSIPLDIDSFRPTGEFSSILSSTYEALKLKSSQEGFYTQYGVQWKNFVSTKMMEDVFKKNIGDGWKDMKTDSERGIYSIVKDDVRIEMKFLGWIKLRHTKCQSMLHIVPFGYSYYGDLPSTNRGYCGFMTKKVINILREFDEYYMVYPVRMYDRYKIRFKIHGHEYHTPSWYELKLLTSISERKMKSLATEERRGTYINFDEHLYKRKKISFKVPLDFE